jgi:hypothetical protein
MSSNLLKNAEQSGVYYLPSPRRKLLEASAGELHFDLLPVNIASRKTISEILRELGNALHFPIWYGVNFDALYDCLSDPEWQAGNGHVLLIDGLDNLRLADPDDFATLIEVFQAAAETRRASGQPFWILLDTPARGIATLPEA